MEGKTQELPQTASAESSSGTFVETFWGQVNCKDENNNLINVTNLYTPGHYAVGCVALSMATVLHHYQWPLSGTGEHSYTDSYGSSTGTYEADFGNTIYDMSLMLAEYNHLVSSSEERGEAGKLCFHSAVSLEMDFEHDGSTSNVNRIPRAIANHFRFYGFYKDSGSAVFWDLLDENMTQGVPVILAIKASNGAQHSIVCDGLNYANDKAYYHLNMGWWGASNGWYPLKEDWSAGGYNEITGAVFDLIPCPALNELEDIGNGQAKLSWLYPSNPGAEAYEIEYQTSDGNWDLIKTDFLGSSLQVDFDPLQKQAYRVRAKVYGDYYPSAWSNLVEHIPVTTGSLKTADRPSLYPVPVNDVLNLEGLDDFRSLSIHAVDGKQVYRLELDHSISSLQIETAGWSQGIYFLNIDNGKERVMKKFIKTNY